MKRTFLGARIRQHRRELGITQAAMARRVGISASYLNLIEHNKRGIAGGLLRRIAEALELDVAVLDGAAERRLLEALEELAHSPEMAALDIDADGAGELIGRFPGWARGLAALARAQRKATDLAGSLADRLTHDPFLADTVHRMLQRVAAIRSAAEILVSYENIDSDQRERFHNILLEDTQRLSDVGEALARYFDQTDAASRILTPFDEVEALFDRHANHFAAIEAAAEQLVQGDRVLVADCAEARNVAEQSLGELIDQIIESAPEVKTSLARLGARDALLSYAIGVVLMPLKTFAPLARERRYDIELLAQHLSMDVDLVCLRLSALPVTQGVPRFAYFQANAAGTVIHARNIPGLTTPAYGFACPLWVLYRAQQSPTTILRQRAVFPSGDRFVFLARAHAIGPAGFDQPRHYRTDMLAMSESDALYTAYSPADSVPEEPVGSACRSCARVKCLHRVADPLSG